MSQQTKSQAIAKLDLLKVAGLSQLRKDHDLCIKSAKKPYEAHLAESAERNARIFAKYGAIVYVSEFDKLYGKETQ